MTHVFMVGEVQIGKTTVVDRALNQLELKIGRHIPFAGFCTIAEYASNGDSKVFLISAVPWTEKKYREENCIARRSPLNPKPQAFPQVFEKEGCRLLKESKAAPLLLMDELGFIESMAPKFQNAVFSYLDGMVPILGVIRNKNTLFLNRVRAHPKVKLFRVTLENRDELPERIACELYQYLKRGGSE